jgi:molybdopterin/thiamine biosynthesis adenylyltransferase
MDSIKNLSEEELTYYSRQILLSESGQKGQLKLKNSRVLVTGVGGLGCHSALQLASMGVGHLRLVDRDVVETSNLQRQHLYSFDVLGYPKVEAAAQRLSKINPYIEVEPVATSINNGSLPQLLDGVDVVVDGTDRMAPRYAINRACIQYGVPYIYGAAITDVGNVSTILPKKTACLECFQAGVDDTSIPSCSTVGVSPSIISIIASIQTSEAVKIVLGLEPKLAGKLLFCDLGDMSFDYIKLSRAENCPACGKKTKPLEQDDKIEEICGRDGGRVFIFSSDNKKILKLKTIIEKLTQKGYQIDQSTLMGVNFSKNNIIGSIFNTGVVVIEKVATKGEAIKIYNEINL